MQYGKLRSDRGHRIYRRLPLRQARLEQHLQHHHRRKVQAQHLFQHQLNVQVRTSKHGTIRRLTQLKSTNPIKIMTMNKYGVIKKLCSDTMQYGKLHSNRGPRVTDDFFFVKLV